MIQYSTQNVIHMKQVVADPPPFSNKFVFSLMNKTEKNWFQNMFTSQKQEILSEL